MMMSIGSYVRRSQRLVRRWTSDSRLRSLTQGLGWILCGMVLSAASLANAPLPLPLAVLASGIAGLPSLLVSLGSAIGYRLFWADAGMQGLIWTVAGLIICLALGGRRLCRQMPWLMSALAGLSVAVTGVLFRSMTGQGAPLGLYLLRIGLTMGATRVFTSVLQRRDPVMDWLACGLGVLALAQVGIFSWLELGYVAAGALGAAAPFPAAALAGLALDLAQKGDMPMAAVLCMAFLLRLVPGLPKWTAHAAPAIMYLVAMPLCGVAQIGPAISLGLGGALGLLLPAQTPIAHRRGETGMAQVRLELTAGMLAEAEQTLLEVREFPIDEAALISQAVERACSGCPCRNHCRDLSAAEAMPVGVLHRPLIRTHDLPLSCRKPGRLLLEVRRSQDQYRSIRADRDRQREYRSALIQQYRFLSEYLQDLADSLPKRGEKPVIRYDPQVAVSSAGLENANGDRCLWFAGPGCKYFVVLCDGMGTGIGAAEEGRTAGNILRRLLMAGYPTEHALRSLNSLCALRGRGGAVTVDLAEADLQTGRVNLYKWGAAPSYLLTAMGSEKIGTAGPPPGLSVTGTRETVDKLSLRRGETLILLSDGVDGEAAMRRAADLTDEKPGELASKVLQYGRGNDDATVALIRLDPIVLST